MRPSQVGEEAGSHSRARGQGGGRATGGRARGRGIEARSLEEGKEEKGKEEERQEEKMSFAKACIVGSSWIRSNQRLVIVLIFTTSARFVLSSPVCIVVSELYTLRCAYYHMRFKYKKIKCTHKENIFDEVCIQ